MYRVIVNFIDLKDKNHRYTVGDVYPRDGVNVPEARLKELSSDENRRKMPLIVFEEEKKPRKAKEKN